MTDRTRKKKGSPPRRRLVVQYRKQGDPSAAQTQAVRSAVKKLADKAAVKSEFPGALQVEVAPESEAELRDSIDQGDWDVNVEGTARMPPKPIPEE